MKRKKCSDFFPSVEVAGGGHGALWGQPVAAVAPTLFRRGGGRRRPARLGGPKGRVDRLAAGPIGPKSGRFFELKIGFSEFTKFLEFCTRRFRRNFDVGIFP
jgi:hypothetical protein